MRLLNPDEYESFYARLRASSTDELGEMYAQQRASIGGDPNIYNEWKNEQEESKKRWIIESTAALPFNGPALAKISLFIKHKAELYVDYDNLVFTDLEDSSHSYSLLSKELKNAQISQSIFLNSEVAIHLSNGVIHRIGIPLLPNIDRNILKQIYFTAIKYAMGKGGTH